MWKLHFTKVCSIQLGPPLYLIVVSSVYENKMSDVSENILEMW